MLPQNCHNLTQKCTPEAEAAAPRLLGALGALRIAYEICDRSSVSTALQAGQLSEVILKARVSSEARKRITAIQWSVSVFGLTSIRSIETITMLLDDKNESVASAAELKMKELHLLADSQCSSIPELVSCVLKNYKVLSQDLMFNRQLRVVVAPNAMASQLGLVALCLKSFLVSSSSGFQLFGSAPPAVYAKALDQQNLRMYLTDVLLEIESYDLAALHASASGAVLSRVFEEAILVAQLCLVLGDTSTREIGMKLWQLFVFFIGKTSPLGRSRINSSLSVLCFHTEDPTFAFPSNIIRILRHKVTSVDSILSSPDVPSTTAANEGIIAVAFEAI